MLRYMRELLGQAAGDSGVVVLPDCVWVSGVAKFRGLRRGIEDRLRTGGSGVVLVAHFRDVYLELESMAEEYNRGAVVVRAVLARQLSADGAQGLRLHGSVTLEFLVAERHPLATADAELLSFVGALPCECRIEHHLALDDALLDLFGGEKVRVMLERLGASEEEPISSGLIGRSMLKAQQKIGASARGNLDAHSAAEWLERNTRAD